MIGEMMEVGMIAIYIESVFIILHALAFEINQHVKGEIDLFIAIPEIWQSITEVSLLLDFYIQDNINENGYITRSLNFFICPGTSCQFVCSTSFSD
jgi:hypothetical protein